MLPIAVLVGATGTMGTNYLNEILKKLGVNRENKAVAARVIFSGDGLSLGQIFQ